jgi:hypothetical protein
MITFAKDRILWGEEITPKPIEGLVVWYATPAKGKITSYLMQAEKVINTSEPVLDEEGNEVTPAQETITWKETSAIQPATKTFDDTQFTGNILQELHAIYLADLQQHNPNITFTITLNQ